MYGNYVVSKGAWENGIKEEEKPKNCVECGKCETLCPQHIHIREDLKRVQKDLDEAAGKQAQ